MYPTKNSETIEIQLTAGQGKYKFPSQTNFNNQAIKALEVHRVTKVTKSALGSALCNETALKTASLTLVGKDGKESIKDQPAVSMTPEYLNGQRFEVQDMVITLDKSILNFSDSSAIVSGEVFLMTVYW